MNKLLTFRKIDQKYILRDVAIKILLSNICKIINVNFIIPFTCCLCLHPRKSAHLKQIETACSNDNKNSLQKFKTGSKDMQ